MSSNHSSDIHTASVESNRDQISTVDKSGKRIWIYPKKPSGAFYDKRKWVSYALLIFLIAMPFIRFNGRPFMMFNILENEFIIFGIYFGPQDFHLFVIAMLIAVVAITVFTVAFGRLFCGWVCPQTIFMEMVFRRIEYWLEGDYTAQMRLNKGPNTPEKVIKKLIKHTIFLAISTGIAHIFLSYIIGVDEVRRIVTEPVGEHWQGFIAMVIFTLAFYGVFAFMREQVCTTVCPYGRLQGVLLDEQSLAVYYDWVRGEPRGKLQKNPKPAPKKDPCANACDHCKSGEVCPTEKLAAQLTAIEPPTQGDCIDCSLCVKVCPTGIDIRNGIQLECVNCTACIDACDEVMVKIGKPTGLIKIDSHKGIETGVRKIFTTRVAAYSAVLVALIGLESFLFLSKGDMEMLMLRTPGMLFQKRDDGQISNLYNYQLINKSEMDETVTLRVANIEEATIEYVGEAPHTIPFKVAEGATFIIMPPDATTGKKTNLIIEALGPDGDVITTAKTTFLAPPK